MFPLIYVSSSNSNPVSLPGVPGQFASALGINLLTAQLLCTALVLMFLLLPMLLLTKNWIAHLVVGEVALGFCVAMAWAPPWLFILQALFIFALMSFSNGWIGGSSTEPRSNE